MQPKKPKTPKKPKAPKKTIYMDDILMGDEKFDMDNDVATMRAEMNHHGRIIRKAIGGNH